MNKENNILLRHGFMPMPRGTSDEKNINKQAAIATILCNVSYYGYALNIAGYENLGKLSLEQIKSWWQDIEPELKNITGDDRKMGDFVVYKNFPEEVLSKDEAEYWSKQMLMYWGYPNEYFTEEVKPREGMDEISKPKVLQLANAFSLSSILSNYLCASSRWKKQEFNDVVFLAESRAVDFSKISFKENLVNLARFMIENKRNVKIGTATDVLRLAAGMSNGDVSLREKVKFKRFTRSERRYFLGLLESCQNLEEDVARRKEIWKRFLFGLHVGDYKNRFPNVCKIANDLYSGNLETFNSSVEKLLAKKDEKVLDVLKMRPGEFKRRLSHLIDLFGSKASDAFESNMVLSKLTNAQLVQTRRFLETVNNREKRVFPPKGNWNKLQIAPARHVNADVADRIVKSIGKELKSRLKDFAPKVLDPATELVKLPSNDGEVSLYTRGTVFPIPEGINFIRTASYWKHGGFGNTWFDNGWNFFDSNWKSKGTICWNASPQGFGVNKAAIFSGDPTNSKTENGEACQVIDLYLDKLKRMGIRYAVWNILCYSHVPFSHADEVYASLQWGEDAVKGKLFEPSRSQLSFPITGEQLTKFICYIDLETNQMTFMDANLKGRTNSAKMNENILEEQMPAFVEYLNSLPTVHDLFRDSANKKTGNGYVLYSDQNVELDGDRAYVFKPENENNKFQKVELNNIIGLKR